MVTEFTPVSALIGGARIGVSGGLLMLGLGLMAGISGILGGLAGAAPGADRAWRLAFVLGLITAPLIVGVATGGLPQITMPQSPVLLIVAGLLVGLGTRLGSGCTSGHGVCGISRLSTRSILATLVFMATAVATVYGVRHGAGGGL